MVNLLISNKNTIELDILAKNLTNDKNYIVENATTGKDTLSIYLKVHPDIFILDNSIADIPIESIIDRLSSNPLERKRCNTILTLPKNYNINIKHFSKINEIVLK